MTQRALFLDRDGVINREAGFLYRPEDVTFVDGIFTLCRTAQGLEYKLIVITNQSGIARGLYTTKQFEALMDWMRARFGERGVHLDAVFHCPYHPEHGLGDLRREHPDRKPGIGMILRAAGQFSLDLGASVLIGDRCSDIAAAQNAGLLQAFLVNGTESAPCPGRYTPIAGLGEAEAWLVTHDRQAAKDRQP